MIKPLLRTHGRQLLNGLAPLALGLLVAVYALMRPALAVPPFRYDAETFPASRAELCPGELLQWTAIIHVHAAEQDVVVGIVRTIWSLDRQETAVTDREIEHAIYREDVLIRQRMVHPIPKLPPGAYELRTARIADGYYAQSYTVRFTVPADCEAPR